MKKPVTFLGINGAEALKRKLEEPDKPAINIEDNVSISEIDKDFYYMPSHNLYIAKKRSNLDMRWYQAHEALHQEQSRMLTIPEYIAFLKSLKSGNQEMQSIYEDITAIRNPWRSEWLDAYFKVVNKKLYINYAHNLVNNKLQPGKSEPLDDITLMKDKTPGISLEDWIENPTKQGLPREDVKPGSLYYWHPRNETVAWFCAYADRADLDCYGNPLSSYSALGVRRAKIKV